VLTRPRQQLGVRARGPLHQPRHGVQAAAEVHLELREQLVGERQLGVQLERAAERCLGLDEVVRRPAGRYLPITWWMRPEARPRGRERRIRLDARSIEVARHAPLLGVVAQLVAAQEVS
jgi:hypothetical protein